MKYIIDVPQENTTFDMALWTKDIDIGGYKYNLPTGYKLESFEEAEKAAYEKGYNDALRKHCEICEAKKDAYEEGYQTAKHECEDCDSHQRGYEDGYERGLADAWEAARKILEAMDEGDADFIDSVCLQSPYPFSDMSASEALSRIAAYEKAQKKQEEDAEIRVGDEVRSPCTKPFIVTQIKFESNSKTYCKGFITENGAIVFREKKDCEKTGRHFSEIAAVLEKMQEGEG